MHHISSHLSKTAQLAAETVQVLQFLLQASQKDIWRWPHMTQKCCDVRTFNPFEVFLFILPPPPPTPQNKEACSSVKFSCSVDSLFIFYLILKRKNAVEFACKWFPNCSSASLGNHWNQTEKSHNPLEKRVTLSSVTDCSTNMELQPMAQLIKWDASQKSLETTALKRLDIPCLFLLPYGQIFLL